MMVQHFIELRQRLLQCTVFFLGMWILCFYHADQLIQVCLRPLTHAMLSDKPLIATQLLTSVWVTVELSANVAFFLASPYFLYQVWRFFAPALYHHERRFVAYTMIASVFLFLLGVSCCFFVILPNLCHFLLTYLPAEIQVMPDFAEALRWIIKFLWIFGLGFQIPLLCFALIKMRWVTLVQLTQARRYVIVSAFILGMVLAPPDVVSQTLLALPIWGVYELGVLVARCLKT